MKKANIILMVCYARSGGTLLSRILKTSKKVILLSEVNVQYGINSKHELVEPSDAIKEQMLAWHGVKITGHDFCSTIQNCIEYCQNNDKILIMRDWPYTDFYPSYINNYNPTFQLMTYNVLNSMNINYSILTQIRDIIDIYLSIGGSLDRLTVGYLKYLNLLKTLGIKIYKYEDLTSNSNKFIKDIEENFGLELSNYLEKFHRIHNTTGDIQDSANSRGYNKIDIKPLPRKYANSRTIRQLNNNELVAEANKLFGYPLQYESVLYEGFISKLTRKILG